MLPRFVLGCALPVIVCLNVELLPAQDKLKDEKLVRTVIVPVDDFQKLQMTTKKPLRAVNDANGKALLTFDLNEKTGTLEIIIDDKPAEKLIRVRPRGNDPKTFLIAGIAPGKTRITCTDNSGAVEAYNVVVRPEILVLVEQSERLRLSTKKPIKTITNEGDKIIRVELLPDDPTTVKLTGLASGDTRFAIASEDGVTESYEVVVRSEKAPGENVHFMAAQTVRRFRMRVREDGSLPEIDSAINHRADVLLAAPGGDGPHDLFLIALKPGFTRLEMTSQDREKGVQTETHEIIVRSDGPIPKDHIVLTPGQEYRMPVPKAAESLRIYTYPPESEVIKRKPNEDKSAVIVSCTKEMGFAVRVVISDRFPPSEVTQFFTVRKEKPQPK